MKMLGSLCPDPSFVPGLRWKTDAETITRHGKLKLTVYNS